MGVIPLVAKGIPPMAVALAGRASAPIIAVTLLTMMEEMTTTGIRTGIMMTTIRMTLGGAPITKKAKKKSKSIQMKRSMARRRIRKPLQLFRKALGRRKR